MKYLILSLILSTSCGYFKTRPNRENRNINAELEAQYNTYHALAQRHQDANGFILTDECDSLLWSSLFAVAVNEEIEITAARNSSGQWFRRPSQDCLATGASKSTISKDMFYGLFVYLLVNKEGQLIEDIWDYGEAHNWVMGDAVSEVWKVTRAVFNPNIISLLAQLRYKLNGNDAFIRHTPGVYTTKDGYPSHLTMLSIFSAGKANGKITENQLEALQEIRKKNPSNPLAQALVAKYTDGNYDNATNLLLAKFPRDRLPTTADWCSSWVVQRADSEASTYTPCSSTEPKREHTGGDFLFTAAIILNRI